MGILITILIFIILIMWCCGIYLYQKYYNLLAKTKKLETTLAENDLLFKTSGLVYVETNELAKANRYIEHGWTLIYDRFSYLHDHNVNIDLIRYKYRLCKINPSVEDYDI